MIFLFWAFNKFWKCLIGNSNRFWSLFYNIKFIISSLPDALDELKTKQKLKKGGAIFWTRLKVQRSPFLLSMKTILCYFCKKSKTKKIVKVFMCDFIRAIDKPKIEPVHVCVTIIEISLILEIVFNYVYKL